MAGEDGSDAIVVVLVDEQHTKDVVRLSSERGEQPVELLDALDRCDDQVEGGQIETRHEPYASAVTGTRTPLVSILLAVHDGARYVGAAVESILRQTVTDLELIVVDDASNDETPVRIDAIADERMRALRNDDQLGLAASLNRGLDAARGRYVARLDDDDVSVPNRLERQLERMRSAPKLAIVGSAVADLDQRGNVGYVHRQPRGTRAVRWHSLFSSPFFHPTVLFERDLVERERLRYDEAFIESEDYELWTRLLVFAEGGNVDEPLVLKRVHAGQASLRRRGVQASFQQLVALREIARVAPEVDAKLAWSVGSGRGVARESAGRAVDEYVSLLRRFEATHGVDREVRELAARAIARAVPRAERTSRLRIARRAAELRPTMPAHVLARRSRAALDARRLRRRVASVVRTEDALRVTVVSPEPTPYRAPLFDRIAARADIELTVLYAARTVAARTWSVHVRHRARFLRGVPIPGLRRVLRHEYPLTPGVVRALHASRPDVVVVSGWSTFAAQAAIAWARRRDIPVVLLVESHDLGPRARWRRAVKEAVVPRLVRRAAAFLAVGSAARDSLVRHGADPQSVRIFANTIDITGWEGRVSEARRNRSDEDVLVISVARLAPEKGLDTLIRAVAEAGVARLRLVVAGAGPERSALESLAARLGVRADFRGAVPRDALVDLYVEADIFALLSRHEPWGVVVNEAAATGLPLVLSDRVGAAHDLLRDGENGFVVRADDAAAAATALQRLADDPFLRQRMGERSRQLVRTWDYGPSVEGFVESVREATRSR
jgi:glycosyltransferase involved in cell wall biosynthesis